MNLKEIENRIKEVEKEKMESYKKIDELRVEEMRLLRKLSEQK